MTTHRKIANVLRFGFCGALLGLATIALTAGTAGAAGQFVTCSASGSGFRQLATVSVSERNPNICIRVKLGTPATPGTPDCWSAVRQFGLSCVDPFGNPNIIDL